MKQINAAAPGHCIETTLEWINTEAVSLTLDNSNLEVQNIRVNSMFNPVIPNPVTGLKPTAAGFREWAQFYNSYLVQECTIECTFVNTSPNPLIVGLVSFPTTTNTFGWTQYRSIPSNTFPNSTKLLSESGGRNDRTTLKLHLILADIIGNWNQYESNLLYSAKFDQNPAQFINAFVFIQNSTSDELPGLNKVDFNLSLTFKVRLYQPKLLITTFPNIPETSVNMCGNKTNF